MTKCYKNPMHIGDPESLSLFIHPTRSHGLGLPDQLLNSQSINSLYHDRHPLETAVKEVFPLVHVDLFIL